MSCFVLHGYLAHKSPLPRVVLCMTLTPSFTFTYHSEIGNKIERHRLTLMARPEHGALQGYLAHNKEPPPMRATIGP